MLCLGCVQAMQGVLRSRGNLEESHQDDRQKKDQNDCQEELRKTFPTQKGSKREQTMIFHLYFDSIMQQYVTYPISAQQRISFSRSPQASPASRIIANRSVSPHSVHHQAITQKTMDINHNQTQRTMQNYNPQAPAFRQLRQRYIRSPSTPILPDKREQKNIDRSEEEPKRLNPKKLEEVKMMELKKIFGGAPCVYVDKKLNVTQIAKDRDEQIKPTNTRIECILEEKQHLEQSKALFSELAFYKKKAQLKEEESENLRAQIYKLKSQLSKKEEGHIEKEQRLQQQVRQLRIDLKKNHNEMLMAKINQAQIQKKCKRLTQKNVYNEQQIERLSKLLADRDSQQAVESTTKSETVMYVLN